MNREKQILTHKQFAQRVIETKGAPFFVVRSVTNVSASKGKNAPQVLQEVFYCLRAGHNYENTVNARLKAEGKAPEFKAKPLPWGQHVLRSNGSISGIIEHKGTLYIQSEIIRSISGKRFFLDGEEVAEEVARPFMRPDSKLSERQLEAGLSAEKVLKPKTFKLESLKEISYCGSRIELSNT